MLCSQKLLSCVTERRIWWGSGQVSISDNQRGANNLRLLGMRQRDSEAFWKSFRSTDDLLETLRTKTPDLPRPGSNTTDMRTLLLIHSLINAAIIKLHSIFSYANVTSNQKCIMAASDMFTHHGVDLRALGPVNSIFGVSRLLNSLNSFWMAPRRFGISPALLSSTRSQDGSIPQHGKILPVRTFLDTI